MYVSLINQLYSAIANQIDKQLKALVDKISSSTDIKFMQLRFTQLLIKVFSSLLSLFATLYEFITYCLSMQFSSFMPNDLAKGC